jgi:hypothetical protein
MDNQLLKSIVPPTSAPVKVPAPVVDEGQPVLFLDLDPDEIDEIGQIHDFVMPIINEAKTKFTQTSMPSDIAVWVGVKLNTPGLKLPKRMAALNPEILKNGLVEEIQAQLASGVLVKSIQEQVLTAFNEMIENNPYGETADLIVMLEGFSSSIDVLILQNENKLTDAQKYEIWSYKADITGINRLIDTNGVDDYDTLIAMSNFRKKLGAK